MGTGTGLVDREAVDAALSACQSISRTRPGRRVPSPSSVTKCTRQIWYTARGYKATEERDPESYIAAETGTLTEPLLEQIVVEAGLVKDVRYAQDDEERELTELELARMGLAGGQMDQLGTSPVDGTPMLVEYKRKPADTIVDLWNRGMLEVVDADYSQVQTLMHSISGSERIAGEPLTQTLYVAAAESRRSMTNVAIATRTERKPGLFISRVPYSRAAALAIKARVQKIWHFIRHVDDPAQVQREYNPSDRKFPCMTRNRDGTTTPWCPFLRECIEAKKREPRKKRGRVGSKWSRWEEDMAA